MNVFQFIVQNHAEVLELTLEHLWMVAASTLLAVLIGIPLGILITRKPGWDKPVLGGANIIQTVPSLALFGFLLPVPWIGARSDRLAILALTLYALLPLIRNTYAGINGVDRSVVEAGRGMGMTDRQLLFQVELPLALGVIIAGVRVAAGVPDRRLGPDGIAAALSQAGLLVGPVRPAGVPAKGSRPFVAVAADGRGLFIKALGPDQRQADLLYRAYRAVRRRPLARCGRFGLRGARAGW